MRQNLGRRERDVGPSTPGCAGLGPLTSDANAKYLSGSSRASQATAMASAQRRCSGGTLSWRSSGSEKLAFWRYALASIIALMTPGQDDLGGDLCPLSSTSVPTRWSKILVRNPISESETAGGRGVVAARGRARGKPLSIRRTTRAPPNHTHNYSFLDLRRCRFKITNPHSLSCVVQFHWSSGDRCTHKPTMAVGQLTILTLVITTSGHENGLPSNCPLLTPRLHRCNLLTNRLAVNYQGVRV